MSNLAAAQIIFRTEFSRKFAFRGRLVTEIFLQALKLFVPLLTWHSLYQGRDSFGVYSFDEMISYVVILNFISLVFSMAHGSELASMIKTGRLSSVLLRPLSLLNEFLPKFLARAIFSVALVSIPVLALVGATGSLSGIQVSPAGLILILLNLCFCFQFGMLFGAVAFWLNETWPLAHLSRALIAIVGGLWFPLDLLPGHLSDIFIHTPFAHLGYLNAAALLGHLSEEEIIKFLTLAPVWILVSGILYRVLLKHGIQKYEAVGA